MTDHNADISDAWMEVTDPENKRGEIAMGYFNRVSVDCYAPREGCYTRDGYELASISIEDTSGIVTRSRDWAMKMMGYEAITRIEDAESEVFQ